MEHYFIDSENLEDEIKEISYFFGRNKYSFMTNSGLFSKDHVDVATDILLKNIPKLSGSLLDLGCGYGCIGIVLAKEYGLKLTQSDVNKRAVYYTKINCDKNSVVSNVIVSNCLENIDGTFDTITLNPPIHAGKTITYQMYEQAFEHLNCGGKLYVVTLKKHGALSTIAKLKEVFLNCDIIYKKSGFYVMCAQKN